MGLHSVTSNGIYVRPLGRAAVVSDLNPEQKHIDILKNTEGNLDDLQEVWLPFLFLPFLALAWAYPWGWYW